MKFFRKYFVLSKYQQNWGKFGENILFYQSINKNKESLEKTSKKEQVQFGHTISTFTALKGIVRICRLFFEHLHGRPSSRNANVCLLVSPFVQFEFVWSYVSLLFWLSDLPNFQSVVSKESLSQNWKYIVLFYYNTTSTSWSV